MFFQKLTAAIVLTFAWCQPGFTFQGYADDPKQQFQLKAVQDDKQSESNSDDKRPELSRQDMAVNPPGLTAMPQFNLKAESGITLNQSKPEQGRPDEEQSSMNEYGVDWSRWVGELADRWFFNLKKLEEQSGLQFHTAQACLIKFTCYPNGQISDISLKQSSGIPLYDRLQAQALLQTVPVSPFPPGTQRNSFTLVQGWESHPRKHGEHDYRPGSYGKGFPMEIVKQWIGAQ